MASDRDASEISPLLGKTGNGSIIGRIDSVAVDGGLTTNAADITADVERRTSLDEGRTAQFQGSPEIQKKLKYIVPALSVGILLSAADQTIIVSSYGTIGNELKALNLTSWIATSYFLTLTSFQPLYGKLSDIFGRKACLLYAYAVFGLGCLFCGLSQDIKQLIAARVFQGIGGGGMTTVVSILISDIVPLEDRGLWQGYINIIYATGAGCGAPLGGLLADSIGWRWSFLGQAPLCLVAFISVFFVLKLPPKEEKNWKTNLGRIDFLGALVLVFAVFDMLLGLDRGSNVSWSTPLSYGPLVASVLLFALFILVEMKYAAEPFAPGHIIFDRSLFAGYLCNFFSFSGWLSGIYYIPLFFQAVDGHGAAASGVRLLPAILAGVTGSLLGGLVMKKTGKYYWLTVTAYTMLVGGMVIILLFAGTIVNSTWGLSLGMVLCGFGNGVGVTTTLIALISNAAPEDQAVTTACSYLFRSLGSVIGISLSSTVVQQSLRSYLIRDLGSGEEADRIVQRVRRSLEYIRTLDPEVRDMVRRCYGHAVRDAFALMIGITFFALISSFFIREKRLSR
ncbi:hypothetical protein EPUS_01282 [Endocarpon pusillum Z07020]|uniref:Major facilitator superfamily (MFS) profile domain-containing protein n=1 Tax=Endocarpon pusillum (strain Z07020 / HMAS-L-300199) TaxID=1263415 RepID=U1GV40_ENDPU|nr:uncharacterized protein EPUS_01282 [Endocarpon pusillum Z07020]ERF75916.1 hypothetical protein EPUS_01282 [Endocarpon pusillum Z07020]